MEQISITERSVVIPIEPPLPLVLEGKQMGVRESDGPGSGRTGLQGPSLPPLIAVNSSDNIQNLNMLFFVFVFLIF